MEKLPYLLILFVPFIFSLSVHEAAHAWTANRCGDPTAKFMGRLTLNPLAHMDVLGTVLFPVISFFTGALLIGWARPVPVNERNFRRWRWDGLLVAAAGPLSNLALAVAFTGALYAVNRIEPLYPATAAGFAIAQPLKLMASVGVQINVILALFNLIPMPPLDGGRVAAGLFPRMSGHLAQLERYGFILLFLLLFTGVLGPLVFRPARLLAGLLLSFAV